MGSQNAGAGTIEEPSDSMQINSGKGVLLKSGRTGTNFEPVILEARISLGLTFICLRFRTVIRSGDFGSCASLCYPGKDVRPTTSLI